MNTQSFFAVQVAATRSPGGIETAILSYGAMFREAGIPSLCLYRGPASAAIEDAGIETIPFSYRAISVAAYLPGIAGRIQCLEAIDRMRAGRDLLFVIHSDKILPALRRRFPRALFIAPCHSDKAKRKARADLAITLNSAQQALISSLLKNKRCRAVQLGNPFECRGEDTPAGTETRLIFCARFTPVKDPLGLIRAYATLERPPTLVMIGDGPLMTEAQTEARAATRGKVEFLGWRADPWTEIRTGDILVSPSSWEGLPYMLLEALDRAVPIIASDIAGHRAALGDGAYGILFPPGDHNALAAALGTALGDIASLKRKARAGQNDLPQRFSPKAFWPRLSEELSKINRTPDRSVKTSGF